MSEKDLNVTAMLDQIAAFKLPILKMATIARLDEAVKATERYEAECRSRLPGWQFFVAEDMATVRAWLEGRGG